ncbi:MAG: TonB-dependent receptor, partial [Bacteroidales bacterium]|nr:TonB-dependent receptor [Bacteroidales bacterium]
MKGGYNADYGDRVGGIVEIMGINGNTRKPSINLNINNMTVNGMASIPVKNRSALTFAYRHTYYNLYDADDLSVNILGKRGSKKADISVYPDYVFRDVNLKYAGSAASGDSYYMSLYEGRDQFSYAVDQDRNNTHISQFAEEKNRQMGGTLFYGKVWKNGNNSHLSLSTSSLDNDQYENQEVTRTTGSSGGTNISNQEIAYNNRIIETSLQNKNFIAVSRRHNLVTGWKYTYNNVVFREDSSQTNITDSKSDAHRLTFFTQDEISVASRLVITPGIRIDVPLHLGKVYVQPRIKASVDLSDQWRINLAWGIYNQFISETSVIDDLGNYRYFWGICNNEDIPVLQARHLVGGIIFNLDGWTTGLEAFYKTTEGITRYISLRKTGPRDVYQGEAQVYGMDLLLKKYFGKHEMWASYT